MREARSIQTAIGEVLLRQWDPLGVAEEPACSSEYDAYVGPVYQLLASGASDREIAQHLAEVETRMLGYADTHWRMLVPVAHKLRKAYRRLTTGPPAT